MRITDQRRNVMPTVCVKSGERTDHAMQARAVALAHPDRWVIAFGLTATTAWAKVRHRPTVSIAVPVSEATWRTWQSRLRIAVVATAVGAAFLLVGAIRGISMLIVVGAIVLALGWLNRVRAWHNAWIGLEYRPTAQEVVLTRVHSAFDAEAGEIYRRSVTRGSRDNTR
ncbi:MAG: hypothetical protein JWM34_5050 [Ilumatobacteraceae bacterium]|nr:hypothetical protein [Ilumatobacteraceae bacterium]